MNQQELLHELRKKNTINHHTIPGIKIKQPWATWIFYQNKSIEIRTRINKYKGIIGIIATSWDKYFRKSEIESIYNFPYPQYCILGFCILSGIKNYGCIMKFIEDYELHLNPPEFYTGCELYGWILEDPTLITPIYYTHQRNRGKAELIQLRGQRARVRIPIPLILDKIHVKEVNEFKNSVNIEKDEMR